jgi:hypothetical protein
MKVEIREKFKKEKMLREMPKGHRPLFEQRLQKELHTKSKSPAKYLMIAASVIVLFSLGYLLSQVQHSPRQIMKPASVQVSLEEFSPELKKIETYYLTAINFEMANLNVTEENKMILDTYFRKMNAMTNEYQVQSGKLDINKVDEELINNLIDNLQMRLQLMIELKNELKKLKSKKDEKNTI